MFATPVVDEAPTFAATAAVGQGDVVHVAVGVPMPDVLCEPVRFGSKIWFEVEAFETVVGGLAIDLDRECTGKEAEKVAHEADRAKGLDSGKRNTDSGHCEPHYSGFAGAGVLPTPPAHFVA
jgi:hypothetical protein